MKFCFAYLTEKQQKVLVKIASNNPTEAEDMTPQEIKKTEDELQAAGIISPLPDGRMWLTSFAKI